MLAAAKPLAEERWSGTRLTATEVFRILLNFDSFPSTCTISIPLVFQAFVPPIVALELNHSTLHPLLALEVLLLQCIMQIRKDSIMPCPELRPFLLRHGDGEHV